MQIPKMPTLGQAIQENFSEKQKVRGRKVNDKGKRVAATMPAASKPKARRVRKGETLVLIKHQGKPDEVRVVRSDEELEKVRQQLKDTDYIMVKDQDLAGTRVTHKSPTFGGRRAKFSKKRQAVG
jgi:hypothetical protein